MAQDEREFLLGIFLMEAWDTLGALEEGLTRLSDPGAPTEATLAPLLVLTHRLKGAAGLHGFPGVSELAAAAESLLDAAPAAAPADWAQTARFLGEMTALLKELLDGITATGVENADRIAAFLARRPLGRAASAASVPPPPRVPDRPSAVNDMAAPAGAPAGAGATAERFGRELERFFSDAGDILTYFAPEATEHLEIMTAALLALEREGRSEEHLGAVLRAAHTLKGAAYTVGCVPVGDVAHQLEDLLVAVRERRLAFTPAVVETMLAGVDALKLVLQRAGAASADVEEGLEHIIDDVRALMSSPDTTPAAVGEPAAAALAPAAPALERAPLFGPSVGARPWPPPLRPVHERAPEEGGPSIRVNLDRLDSLMNLVGELMIARSRLELRLTELDRVGDQLLFSRSRMARALRDFEGKHHDPRLPTRRADRIAPLDELFAELEFDRYDDFNILARSLGEVSADVGEVKAQHAALVRAIKDDVAQIQRLTVALRKEVTRSRMVPIGRLFPRFARQVKEAARAAGKTVAFEVHGGSVEVDNTTVEQMADSLLHLVQNAISHGIEPEDERVAGGKPAQGTVALRAHQHGGFIVVEIEDDGRGMDPELLTRQAVERGLLGPDEAQALTRPEALNLVFVPGFSTVSLVTRASGRGVGLDVVRTNVTRLNGEIEVDTEAAVRTRFTIKLPLTLAIADALLVRVGSEVLAVPLTTVGVMRLLGPADVQRSGDREVAIIDGQSVDLFRLGRVLGLAEPEPTARIPVVVLRSGGKPFAIAVDELLGKEEIVIKSLGGFLEGVGPWAGATISGEGRVILLLDPSRLLELARRRAVTRVPELEAGGLPATARREEAWRRVLLVDDSISVRRFVGQMLEKAGFQVFTAVDGQDALERLTEISVEVIVTDLEMPRVNGYALIEDLRRRPGTREVPIVVLTTRAGEKHQDLARRLGIEHYVTKPVDEQVFVALIDSIASPAARMLSTQGSA